MAGSKRYNAPQPIVGNKSLAFRSIFNDPAKHSSTLACHRSKGGGSIKTRIYKPLRCGKEGGLRYVEKSNYVVFPARMSSSRIC